MSLNVNQRFGKSRKVFFFFLFLNISPMKLFRKAEDPSKSPRGNVPSTTSPRKTVDSKDSSKRTVLKSGWLKKKNKKRFLALLDDSWLYWFAKEMDLGHLNEALPRCKGRLFLSWCNPIAGTKPKEIAIVNPNDDNYILVANDVQERDSWLDALQSVSAVHKEMADSSSSIPEKRGTLKFRNIDKWFVLRESVLMWFAAENDSHVEGSLSLTNATVALGATLDGGAAFVVANIDGKYVLGAESREVAEEWVELLRNSIRATRKRQIAKKQEEEQQLQQKEMKEDATRVTFKGQLNVMGGDLFYCVLEGSVMMWLKDDVDIDNTAQIKKHVRGFVALRLGHKVKELPDLPSGEEQFGFTIASEGTTKQVTFLSSQRVERDRWVEKIQKVMQVTEERKKDSNEKSSTEREGFLNRGKLKFWAVCKDGTFMMYEGKGMKKAVVTIGLADAGVLEARDDNKSFLLFTNVPSLEVIECLGRAEESKKDRSEWIKVIQQNIDSAAMLVLRNLRGKMLSANSKAAAKRFREQKKSGTGMCFSLVRKSELFFSIEHTSLVWYKSEQHPNAKGSAHLCGCHTQVEGRRVSVFGSDEKLVVGFDVVDEQEAISWDVALQEATFEADEERNYKKFGFLETKGKSRWVAVSRRHCMWFSAPMRIADIQNVGAFDSVLLPECDLTTFGDRGFVLSERKENNGLADKVKVVSFTAATPEEATEWIAMLQSLVRENESGAAEPTGVPYAAWEARVEHLPLEMDFPLFGLNVPEDVTIEVTGIPKCVEMTDIVFDQPIAESPYQLHHPGHLRLTLANMPQVVTQEWMPFQMQGATCSVQGAVRITVRNEGSDLSLASGKKPLPLVLSKVVCEVTLYQRSKREMQGAAWMTVREDLSSVQTVSVLLAKRHLENALCDLDTEPTVVDALWQCVSVSDVDQVVQAFVHLFSARGQALTYINRRICTEIAEATVEETLFRTNSVATKLGRFFSDLVGSYYLVATLKSLIDGLVSPDCPSCEVDPSKLEDPSVLPKNQANLKNACLDVLNAVFKSINDIPPEIAVLCGILWRESGAKFGEFKYKAVGGFMFLRFLCPALLTPESHGLFQGTLTKENRRNLTLVTKVLQNISNGVEFGKKEEFMVCMNSLITQQIPNVQKFFHDVVMTQEASDTVNDQKRDVPPSVIDRSVDTIYKHILFQKAKLEEQHPEVWEVLQPYHAAIGVPAKLKKAMANAKK